MDNENLSRESAEGFASQWAILPARVRYDAKLPPNAKLLFAEIAAKTNTLGYCWAYNQYFAEKLGVGADRISGLIGKLEEAGYIAIEYDRERANTDKRRIYLTAAAFSLAGGIGKNADTQSPQKCGDGPGKNADTGIGKNAGALKENNKNKMGPERPRYMALDIFKAIGAWCGEDGDLMLAWMQYADMRQRTRHPIGTVATVTRACQKIEALANAAGGGRAYMIGLLHKATDCTWRGFYPLSRGDEGFEADAQRAAGDAGPYGDGGREEAIEWV